MGDRLIMGPQTGNTNSFRKSNEGLPAKPFYWDFDGETIGKMGEPKNHLLVFLHDFMVLKAIVAFPRRPPHCLDKHYAWCLTVACLLLRCRT